MRQKITKMLLSTMLAVICVLNMGITAYADEEYDSGMTKEDVIAKYTVDTGNEQADEVFNQFLESFSELLVDEEYASTFESLESIDELWKKNYLRHTDGTSENWTNMTTFEKLLWDYLYITPMAAMSKSSYTSCFDTLELYEEKVYGDNFEVLVSYNEAMAEAYKRIMEWQYYYIKESGAAYNFMTGMDSAGRTEIAEVTQFVMEESVEVPESSEANAEVAESSEEMVEAPQVNATEEPVVEEEKGIWKDTLQSLKEKWLTFLILGILVIALAGVTIYRKSKAIDDDKVA